jgi:RHS repeat-associated protein
MQGLRDWATEPGQWYRYNGKERDTVSGWYEYGFRWYIDEIGRWNGVDPLADWAPGWTPFRYGFNNPVLFIDPDGLFERKKDAKKYRRDHHDKEIRRGKIKQDDEGSYSIRYGENGSISQNSKGEMEYASVGTYTGDYARQRNPNLFEKGKDKLGFVGKMAYSPLNSAWLTIQTFNPFDTHITHLSGDYASKDEYTMGFVNTAMTAVPFGRGTSAVRSAVPSGVNLIQKLNAAQFSKTFKGTTLARMQPSDRGTINRGLNNGIDYLNKRVETGGILFTTVKGVGNQIEEE